MERALFGQHSVCVSKYTQRWEPRKRHIIEFLPYEVHDSTRCIVLFWIPVCFPWFSLLDSPTCQCRRLWEAGELNDTERMP